MPADNYQRPAQRILRRLSSLPQQSSAPAESAKSEEATASSPAPQPLEVGRSPAVVFLRRTAYVLLSAAIMTVGLYGGYAVLKNRAASEAAPPLLEGIPFSSVLYSRENVLLRIVPAADGIFRVKTPLESIDPKLVEATIAYEDRNFYKHPHAAPSADRYARRKTSADLACDALRSALHEAADS